MIDERELTAAAPDAKASGVSAPATATATATPSLEEPFSYRLKTKLLGKPLHSERLEHETLGKPTALAVFASDCISSCAYASEEILHVLVPVVGIAAFDGVAHERIRMIFGECDASERKFGEVHGHRIAVHAVKTALDDGVHGE